MWAQMMQQNQQMLTDKAQKNFNIGKTTDKGTTRPRVWVVNTNLQQTLRQISTITQLRTNQWWLCNSLRLDGAQSGEEEQDAKGED